jgi:predicted ABC-type ATPase
VIRRRFFSGRENFERVYKSLVDEWWLYDNSTRASRLIEQGSSR